MIKISPKKYSDFNKGIEELVHGLQKHLMQMKNSIEKNKTMESL